MKKIALLFLLVLPLLSSAQDTLTYKGSGRIFNSSQQKLTSDEVRGLFVNNTEALSLYNSGKTKQTLGNILFYGGISTVIIKHISMLNKYSGSNALKADSNNIMYFVGAGMVIIAIPIKLGFSKKIKKAVSLINEDFKKPNTGFNIESTSFVSNANGFGISITF
jgi:hypothetical protein